MLPSFTTMSEYLVPPCSPIASTVLSFLVTTSSMRLLIMYIAMLRSRFGRFCAAYSSATNLRFSWSKLIFAADETVIA